MYRVESDGTPPGTNVYFNDVRLEGVTRVMWSIRANTVSKMILVVDDPARFVSQLNDTQVEVKTDG
jgi:hypothetical protein